MRKIPIRLVERLMKEKGAKRISRKSKKLVAVGIEKLIGDLTERAVKNARHFGRKLILGGDIEQAFKLVLHKKI